MIRHCVVFVMCIVVLLSGCSGSSSGSSSDQQGDDSETDDDSGGTATTDASGLLQPEDLEYLGAFRLPEGNTPNSWDWAGGAMTYYPDGATDGLPGSLFAAGNGPLDRIAEISIPTPLDSSDVSALNFAMTRQNFADVSGGLFDVLIDSGVPEIGIEYLNNETAGEHIHMTWGANLQGEGSETDVASHGWFDIDLSSPNAQGGWSIGSQNVYSVNNYIFTIPTVWADTNVGGRYLATGRYKDGGLGGKGPQLFAYAPWLQGDPPVNGTTLNEVTLLKYDSTLNGTEADYTTNRLNNYSDADAWIGGAWITTPAGRSGVIFVGTKATGDYYWYGYVDESDPTVPCVEDEELSFTTCRNSDGTSCDDSSFSGCADRRTEKGWWSDRFDTQIIFYDPANLAEVAAGTMESYEPQPYDTMDIDDRLYLPNPSADVIYTFGSGDQRKHRVIAVAYDATNNYLYIMEAFADESCPVVHVWRVSN